MNTTKVILGHSAMLLNELNHTIFFINVSNFMEVITKLDFNLLVSVLFIVVQVYLV